MMYGKLVDGKLVQHNPAVDYITLADGTKLYTNDGDILLERGYKPIEFNQPEESERIHAVGYTWAETADDIRREWEYIEDDGTLSNEEIYLAELDAAYDTIGELVEMIFENDMEVIG